MAEYILPVSDSTRNTSTEIMNAARNWQQMPDLTRGFIEALFFTSNDPGVSFDDWRADSSVEFTDGQIPSDAGFADLAPELLADIESFCDGFSDANRAALDALNALEPGTDGNRYARDWCDDQRAGQLLYYACNGHGVSFADDGDSPVRLALQNAASYRWEKSAYVGDDGKIYAM